ncbi:MAG: UvrB/UvrC motif-containing protein, partial [Alistipes sp.]|nr:UvrB/UvrC motif-containing protein [Alistipes sp.]
AALYTMEPIPTEIHYRSAADVDQSYTAGPIYNEQELDLLIDRARSEMEQAAKALDFQAAARYRDRMYELQKLRDESRLQH